ncbi:MULTISPECIES: hypothetical protein [unclassified Actinopolyspora]|uniref:hypothetical protein n=1 Tax=unclassified Actinopolyspora TaxID=2639451 RepID=UPI0013F69AA5|nr:MULTISPECIES: hypothetical protein [unclassified Actinopolyspora]NHD18589.1 hypothetical protein [Actinopolyspora sp. BKK2]NHE77452.1 hypothetical protein [Actinopolyspora sp. BKK1]
MTLPQPPQAGPPPHPYAAQPVVYDVGRRVRRNVLIGGAVLGPFGLLLLISAFRGGVDGGVGARVFTGLFGCALIGVALLVLLFWPVLSRTQQLFIEPPGVRWHDPRGKPFAIRWEELAAVELSRKWMVRRMGRPGAVVRLDLFPADVSFRSRHPEMEHLWERDGLRGGYRLPIGADKNAAPLLDEAVQRFHPRARGGIRETGRPHLT